MSIPTCYIAFEINSDGAARISHWVGGESKDLLPEGSDSSDMKVDGIELQVSLNNDDDKDTVHDGVKIELTKFHINAQTDDEKETYSLGLTTLLSWQDAERLHLFLGCLLNIHRDTV